MENRKLKYLDYKQDGKNDDKTTKIPKKLKTLIEWMLSFYTTNFLMRKTDTVKYLFCILLISVDDFRFGFDEPVFRISE